jgi:acyl-CoA synthetase (NDP forming)
VIVIKSGKSKRGAQAAASHTGSLAGSDDIFDAIMKQCGVLRAECLEDAFNWCKFMISGSAPRTRNTVIVTNGGGVGVMATDACEKYGVSLYDDQAALRGLYEAVTHTCWINGRNPIVLTGGRRNRTITRAFSVTRI